MRVKEGDIVALPSVDLKRIIYVYRVESIIQESTNRSKLKWKNNITPLLVLENRRGVRNNELYAQNKRLLVNGEMPEDILNRFLEHEQKEMDIYLDNLKDLTERAVLDIERGYTPSLFLKYGELSYYLEESANKKLLREEITIFNDIRETIQDLTKLGYLHGNHMISYESKSYEFKSPDDVFNKDIDIEYSFSRILRMR